MIFNNIYYAFELGPTALAIDQLRKKLYVDGGVRLLMFAAQDLRTGGRQE